MTLKTLELRARRDAFVVFFMGFFLVLTNFLYSQSLPLAFAMVLAVWGLLTALVLAHMPVGQPSLARASGLAARMCLVGAPIMLTLFVLFPRFGPLWGLPQDAASSRTGLSDSMSMGTVAELALDDSIALTLKFDGPAPPPEAMYFRGPVFGVFDGKEWRPLPASVHLKGLLGPELRVAGRAVAYEMTVEPTKVPILPLLELTSEPPELDKHTLFLRSDLQWSINRPLMERQRVGAVAHTRFEHGPLRPVSGLQAYLALPAGYNPRMLAWAAALRSEHRRAGADATVLAQAVLRHIRTQPYTYTLAPPTYGDGQGRHAIDEFWFERRSGFCEHFASAFVVAMRAMGVPARIVTGYQGAERNPVDGYWLVRNSSAHAWAEYWQEGRGWLRADPTAAVAPDRIERHASLRPAPGFVASAFDAVDPGLLRALRERWQALDTAWAQWVLNYSRGQQMNLLKALGFDAPNWQDLALLLLALVIAASSVGAGWAWWERQRQDPWLRTYHAMQAALQRYGLESATHVPPRALAEHTLARWGEAARGVAQVLHQMEALRYAAPAGTPPAGAGTTRAVMNRGATLTRPALRALARRLERALAELPDA